MLYHGFYVKITPLKNIQRERKDGSISDCNGFQIEIFSNQSEEVTVDVFTAAVGFEILKNLFAMQNSLRWMSLSRRKRNI